MAKLTGFESLGMHIRRLLEFQRGFAGDRRTVVRTENHDAATQRDTRGNYADTFVAIEEPHADSLGGTLQICRLARVVFAEQTGGREEDCNRARDAFAGAG